MKVVQGSKKLETAVLLTLCGGYLDAYTYFVRGGVFANAQTGNIIKLGIQIVNGDVHTCMRYLIPILSFTLGVVCANLIEIYMKKRDIHMIRRTVLLIEMCVLASVGLIPAKEEYNLIANTMVSFVCAMQMEAFKTFVNQPIATTVSTGNLRKFIDYLIKGIHENSKEDLKTAGIYGLIVLLFIGGVSFGTLCADFLGIYAVYVVVFFMALTMILITVKTKYIDA